MMWMSTFVQRPNNTYLALLLSPMCRWRTFSSSTFRTLLESHLAAFMSSLASTFVSTLFTFCPPGPELLEKASKTSSDGNGAALVTTSMHSYRKVCPSCRTMVLGVPRVSRSFPKLLASCQSGIAGC